MPAIEVFAFIEVIDGKLFEFISKSLEKCGENYCILYIIVNFVLMVYNDYYYTFVKL